MKKEFKLCFSKYYFIIKVYKEYKYINFNRIIFHIIFKINIFDLYR